MKKFITSILVICILIALCTGCLSEPQKGGDTDKSDSHDVKCTSNGNNSETTNSENEKDSGKEKIKDYHITNSSINSVTSNGMRFITVDQYVRNLLFEHKGYWIIHAFAEGKNIHQIGYDTLGNGGVRDIYCGSIGTEVPPIIPVVTLSWDQVIEGRELLLSGKQWKDPEQDFILFALFPEIVFHEDLTIYNIYIIKGYEQYIYYETSIGDYILLDPDCNMEQLYRIPLEDFYDCASAMSQRGFSFENNYYADILEPYAFESKFMKQEDTTTE